MKCVFVTYLYRVRAADRFAAIDACEDHLGSARADVYTALYLVSFETGERAVLVDADDWRKRRRGAGRFDDILSSEAAAVRHGCKLRTTFYFHLLIGTDARRSIRDTLLREYEAHVTGPETERIYFAATNGIVEETLRTGWGEAGGSLTEYMALRASGIDNLRRHTTDETYPFTQAGADIAFSLCYDLAGEGPRYYIIMDVHR